MNPKKKPKYYPAFDKWRISALARPLPEGLAYRKKIQSIFSLIERITVQVLYVFPFNVERIALDGVRRIIQSHEKNTSIGNKYSRGMSTVAKAYWDARRRTSIFRLPIINEEEDNKPGNQRVAFLLRASEDHVCSSPINDFDTSVHLVKTGVLQDYDDSSIPKLTWVEKVKCSVRVYMRKYVENRKKMWEARQEVR